MKENNFQRIVRIHKNCEYVGETVRRFGDNFELFFKDRDYQDAVCMRIYQIGELSVGLSEQFKEETRDRIPWEKVRGMRNAFAHEYETIDFVVVWNTVKKDIPSLKKFCEEICPSLSGGAI